MNKSEIHIDEENTNLIWGLIAVVSIAAATYMLANAFMAGDWAIAGYTQFTSIALFTAGFYGIIRMSTPLFHFVLRIEHTDLRIEIWQEGDEPVDVQIIPITDISELRIAPHTPRSHNEALYDFSTSYYLLYRTDYDDEYTRLIDLPDESFTLKIDDIKKVMNLLTSHQPDIIIPEQDAIFIERHIQ